MWLKMILSSAVAANSLFPVLFQDTLAINLPNQHSIKQPQSISVTQSMVQLPVPTLANNLSHSSTSPPIDTNVTKSNVLCKGAIWGWHINPASCQAAWASMPTDPISRTYGWRNAGSFEVPLPHRYLSRKSCIVPDVCQR